MQSIEKIGKLLLQSSRERIGRYTQIEQVRALTLDATVTAQQSRNPKKTHFLPLICADER
jgi:hypothetical protein